MYILLKFINLSVDLKVLLVVVCLPNIFLAHTLPSSEDAEEESEGESEGDEDEVGLDYLNKDIGSVRPSPS